MLDSNTTRGQYFIAEQNRTIEWFCEQRDLVPVYYGDGATQSDVLLVEFNGGLNKLHAVAEIKSREKAGNVDLTLEYLKNNGGYLISMSKIEHGKKLSEMHRVPFLVVVSLMKDDYILVWQLTDESGDYVIKNLEMRSSVTKATCNGGTATRINAYLPMQTPYLTVNGKPKQDDGRDS